MEPTFKVLATGGESHGGLQLRRGIAIALFAFAGCAPAAAQDSTELITQFKLLSRATQWNKTGEVKFDFPTYHPQGMATVGETLFLSSVQVIDRARGLGTGHLFKIDPKGELLDSVQLGRGGIYHPGGIDYDGRHIWVPVAEYRPDSRSMVYTVDPITLEPRLHFEFPDHLGAIAHDTARHRLIGVSWGSRRFYAWPLVSTEDGWTVGEPGTAEFVLNGNHFIDYQDCHYLPGSRYMLCSGLNRFPMLGGVPFALGGVDLVDIVTFQAVHQVPIPLWVGRSRALAMTNNPFDYALRDGRIQFLFAPADNDTTLYRFEPKVQD